jgi:hypothetical protein
MTETTTPDPIVLTYKILSQAAFTATINTPRRSLRTLTIRLRSQWQVMEPLLAPLGKGACAQKRPAAHRRRSRQPGGAEA